MHFQPADVPAGRVFVRSRANNHLQWLLGVSETTRTPQATNHRGGWPQPEEIGHKSPFIRLGLDQTFLFAQAWVGSTSE